MPSPRLSSTATRAARGGDRRTSSQPAAGSTNNASGEVRIAASRQNAATMSCHGLAPRVVISTSPASAHTTARCSTTTSRCIPSASGETAISTTAAVAAQRVSSRRRPSIHSRIALAMAATSTVSRTAATAVSARPNAPETMV